MELLEKKGCMLLENIDKDKREVESILSYTSMMIRTEMNQKCKTEELKTSEEEERKKLTEVKDM